MEDLHALYATIIQCLTLSVCSWCTDRAKKHAANEEIFLRKKKELKALILKRKHDQYMKDGTTTIKQAPTSSSGGINASEPYNPCVKKHKVKRYDRRPCLDLQHSDSLCSQLSTSVSSAASDLDAFPTDVPKKHVHQLKNIFRTPKRNQGPVTPYVRQNRSYTDSSGTSEHHQSCSNHFVPSNDLANTKHSESHFPSTSSSSSWLLNTTGTSAPVKFKCSNKSAWIAEINHEKSENFCTVNSSKGVEKSAAVSRPIVSQPVECVSIPGVGAFESSITTDATEKKKLAQKYYHLSGSGWKKDWDGKWIRDEEAEFDSDEEPPDLP